MPHIRSTAQQLQVASARKPHIARLRLFNRANDAALAERLAERGTSVTPTFQVIGDRAGLLAPAPAARIKVLVLRVLGVVGLLLLVLDTGLVVRSVVGNPYWLGSTDGGIYVTAAMDILHGVSPWDYSVAPVTKFGSSIALHMPYFYPPFLAETLWPLMALGLPATRWISVAVVFGCLLASLALLFRGFGARLPWAVIALIAGLACATAEIRGELYHAQADLVLLFLIALGLWLYSRDRATLAGIALGLTFVIKPFLGILILYLVWKRAWRAAIAALITSGALFALSFVPLAGLGTGAILSWLGVMQYAASPVFAASPFNVSMQGLFVRLFRENLFTTPWVNNPAFAQALGVAAYVGVSVLFMRCVSRAMPRGLGEVERKALLLAESGVFLSLAYSASPFTEGSHLVLLVPGLVGLVTLAARRWQVDHALGWRWVLALATWSAIFVLRVIPIRVPGVPAWSEWTPVDGLTIIGTGLEAFVLLAAAVSLALLLRELGKQTVV